MLAGHELVSARSAAGELRARLRRRRHPDGHVRGVRDDRREQARLGLAPSPRADPPRSTTTGVPPNRLTRQPLPAPRLRDPALWASRRHSEDTKLTAPQSWLCFARMGRERQRVSTKASLAGGADAADGCGFAGLCPMPVPASRSCRIRRSQRLCLAAPSQRLPTSRGVVSRTWCSLKAQTTESGLCSGNGAGGFGAPTWYTVAGHPAFISVADFNNDGHPDLLVPVETAPPPTPFEGTIPNKVQILFGDGHGNLTVGQPISLPEIGPIYVGNFTGAGGTEDVIVAPDDCWGGNDSNKYYMLLGNGHGELTPGPVYLVFPHRRLRLLRRRFHRRRATS